MTISEKYLVNVLDMEETFILPEAKCQHYWAIESPNGPTSKGVCKYCGITEEFRNSLPVVFKFSKRRKRPGMI